MRIVKHQLAEFSSIELKPVSDLHIGHLKHRPAVALAVVQWLKEAPNRFTAMAGDMVEMALRDSLGEVYEQKLGPQEQVDAVAEIFWDVRDRILGIVPGNHELRVKERVGIDVASGYAMKLGVPYDPASMVLAVRFGLATKRLPYFFICFTHGWGAARSLIKFKQPGELKHVVNNADVYFTAHTHSPVNYPIDTWEIDPSHLTLVRRTQRFVTLGSGLDHAEYAERKGLAPSTLEFPRIELRYQHTRHGGGAEKVVITHSS